MSKTNQKRVKHSKTQEVHRGNEMSVKKNAKAEKAKKPLTTGQKVLRVIIILVVIGLIAGLGVIFYFINQKNEDAKTGRVEFPDPIYSILTGEEITDASLNDNPTFCVQIPNGNDGARPQAGLKQAGVVFEAIAEAGITRFAAVFQNADTSAIGPVRSLRPYYLDWDTPFGCTVVHAGGSDEAIAALRRGGQREMDENYTYMWREENYNRRWNNLFTSSADLLAYNQEKGYGSSEIDAFPRLTPDETKEILAAQNEDPKMDENDTNTSGSEEAVTSFAISFGRSSTFNTTYAYDALTNTYLRSYENGEPHLVYDCPAGLNKPVTSTSCGDLQQIAPSAVAAMMVHETNMSDNYHQKITTIGSGEAVIFQNGTAIRGTWTKKSQKDQIIFKDQDGQEVKFAPGQLWIAAVPQYGLVQW